MNKMIKRLLCLAIALGVAVIPFTAAFAADKEEDKTMKEEYIARAVNSTCVIDAYGDNNENAVKIQPEDNGFAGVWLALPELNQKKRGRRSSYRGENTFRSGNSLRVFLRGRCG